MTGTDGTDPALRESAIRLLARREHARAELVRKLGQRGWTDDAIQEVVRELAGEGLQSDERFAESFVRSRVARDYGPLRIRSELGQRGIDRALAERSLEAADVDWHRLARDWYQRKYPDSPADARERSRRMQALNRRGFSAEHFRWLFQD